MKKWLHECAIEFTDKTFLKTFFVSVIFLFGSLVLNFYAGLYATEAASNPVSDIVLSNTKAIDLDGTFIYGTLLFWFFIIILCIKVPRQAPFVLKSIALFIVIRSLFISLTHIGPFPDHQISWLSSNIINKFSFGGDLFFSGHTGIPFLMALIFWKHTYLRPIFIVASLFFAAVVLLAHLHYSIDVLSAYFITYTIFHISMKLYPDDQKMFDADQNRMPL